MATLYKFDGSTEKVTPRDGSFTLQELYILLGCSTIEAVYCKDGSILVCDEEGKLRNDWIERINKNATKAFGFDHDVISGNAVRCNDYEFQ
jgi:hypothetical protein